MKNSLRLSRLGQLVSQHLRQWLGRHALAVAALGLGTSWGHAAGPVDPKEKSEVSVAKPSSPPTEQTARRGLRLNQETLRVFSPAPTTTQTAKEQTTKEHAGGEQTSAGNASSEQTDVHIAGAVPGEFLEQLGIRDTAWVVQCLFEGPSKSGHEPAKIPASAKSLPLRASSRRSPAESKVVPKRNPEKEDTAQKDPVDDKSAEASADESLQQQSVSTTDDRLPAEAKHQTNRDGKQVDDASDAAIEAHLTDAQNPPGKAEAGDTGDAVADKAGASDDNSGECPGAPDGSTDAATAHPDDIPLEPSEHPYDAPAATSQPEKTGPAKTQAASGSERLSAREVSIRDRINQCLRYYVEHPETVVRRGPWALMHAALPFGVEAEVIAGRRRVNTIGWMCFNGVCAKQRMFQPTRTGFRTNVGPGVQGHEGQFLAILAQSRVQPDYPIRVGKRRYTINDLIRYEMATCREKSELTFKLIGLSYYLDQNQRWRDNRGRIWNLEKMVAEELAQPINGAACGGSHRLMGLSYAVIQRQQDGLAIDGHWARAEQYLNDYVNYAMTLQNPDGSFSTEWFESRGRDPDVERRVQTTGHILEWLIYTLPDKHLKSPRIQISVEFLLDTVGKNPERDWPIGPRGHALRALSLYQERVFGAQPGQLRSYIAEGQGSSTIR